MRPELVEGRTPRFDRLRAKIGRLRTARVGWDAAWDTRLLSCDGKRGKKDHACVRVLSSRPDAGAFSRNASTATTRRWTGAAEMPSLVKIALTCSSTVDSERNSA